MPTTPQDTRLDLNTATLDQLDAISGIGPVTAQRILDYRASIGRFTSVDQLLDVPGIGVKTLEKIRPEVRV
nr:helix-hairpin-helix domain-containing protein [Bifidobacterium sp. CP2]